MHAPTLIIEPQVIPSSAARPRHCLQPLPAAKPEEPSTAFMFHPGLSPRTSARALTLGLRDPGSLLPKPDDRIGRM